MSTLSIHTPRLPMFIQHAASQRSKGGNIITKDQYLQNQVYLAKKKNEWTTFQSSASVRENFGRMNAARATSRYTAFMKQRQFGWRALENEAINKYWIADPQTI